MDHSYIEEHNLIERYALGRLSPDQQVDFEEHFATCAQCLEGVELAQDLGSALRSVAAEDGAFASAAEGEPTPPSPDKVRPEGSGGRVLPWPQRFQRFQPLAAAAVLILALAPSAWLASRNRGLSGDLERLRRPRANVPAVVLDNLRDSASATRAPVLELPAGEPWLTLALEVGADEGATAFDVVLEDAGDRRLWRGEGLAPTPWGVLSLTFPAEQVPAGSYRLRVTARDDRGREEPIGSFPFEVVRTARESTRP